MKVKYKPSIMQQISEAISTARIENKQIDYIELTCAEWHDFYYYVCMNDLLINTVKNPHDWARNEAMYAGVKIVSEIDV